MGVSIPAGNNRLDYIRLLNQTITPLSRNVNIDIRGLDIEGAPNVVLFNDDIRAESIVGLDLGQNVANTAIRYLC